MLGIGLIYALQPLQGAWHLSLEATQLGDLPLHVMALTGRVVTPAPHRLLTPLEPYVHK